MLSPGVTAPPIELSDLNGHRWTLSEALKKGAVLLAFFKTSCPTCQLTFPFLQRLIDAASPGAPQLVAISQDDAAGTREFQQRFGLAMPAVTDIARAWPASNAYRIAHVPSLFLIEPDGKISLAVDGFNKSAIETLGERFGANPFRETDRVPALRPG